MGAAPTAASSAGFASDQVFEMIREGVKANTEAVTKVSGVFVFKLSNGDASKVWTIDVTPDSPGVYEGEPKGKKGDVTFKIKDDDFVKLAQGKANPQQLFMGGKMKLSGNMAKAMQFDKVLKTLRPKAKL